MSIKIEETKDRYIKGNFVSVSEYKSSGDYYCYIRVPKEEGSYPNDKTMKKEELVSFLCEIRDEADQIMEKLETLE